MMDVVNLMDPMDVVNLMNLEILVTWVNLVDLVNLVDVVYLIDLANPGILMIQVKLQLQFYSSPSCSLLKLKLAIL